jgi:hypothetical protein
MEPIIAITLVRCASLVRSAERHTTDEMAPAPCSERPAIAVQMSCAEAARKLPAGEDHQARVDHGLPAPAVRGHAEGNLQDRLSEAVSAERKPTRRSCRHPRSRARAPRTPADEEQPSMRRPKRRQAGAGAQFSARHSFGCMKEWSEGGVKEAIVASFPRTKIALGTDPHPRRTHAQLKNINLELPRENWW